MKTLTYFLITDCSPLRLVGFDALLSIPEAINDCCTLELKFVLPERPIIWLRNLFPSSFTGPYILQQRHGCHLYCSPINALFGERKSNFAALHFLSSVWLVSENISVLCCGSGTWFKGKKLFKLTQYVCMCVIEKGGWTYTKTKGERGRMDVWKR